MEWRRWRPRHRFGTGHSIWSIHRFHSGYPSTQTGRASEPRACSNTADCSSKYPPGMNDCMALDRMLRHGKHWASASYLSTASHAIAIGIHTNVEAASCTAQNDVLFIYSVVADHGCVSVCFACCGERRGVKLCALVKKSETLVRQRPDWRGNLTVVVFVMWLAINTSTKNGTRNRRPFYRFRAAI